MMNALSLWEGQFLLFLQNFVRTPVGNAILTFFTALGDDGIPWIAAGVILLFFRRTRRAGVLALAAMLFNFLAVNVTLKPLFSRPRPWQLLEELVPLVESSPFRSFPSGHTSSTFAFAAGFCGGSRTRWANALTVAIAALMGFSRMYVGVHYPTDVLAGMAIGILCGVLATFLYRRFLCKRFPLGGT